jgi:putative transposase
MASMAKKRKLLKRFNEPGHVHHLVHTCVGGEQLLLNEASCVILAKEIDVANRKHAMDLLAFVFMPEHIHLVLRPRNADYRMEVYCRDFKRESSRKIKKRMPLDVQRRLIVRERPGALVFRFWQEGGGFDGNLANPNRIQTVIEYVHNNPVRRELCKLAMDWRWTSARRYEGGLHIDDPSVPLVTLYDGM